jgi:hypothetical protein
VDLILVGIVVAENAARLSIRSWSRRGIDNGHPPIQESGDTCSVHGRRLCWRHRGRRSRGRRLGAVRPIGQDCFELRRWPSAT